MAEDLGSQFSDRVSVNVHSVIDSQLPHPARGQGKIREITAMGMNLNPGCRQDGHTTEGAMVMRLRIAKCGAGVNFNLGIHNMFYLLRTGEKAVGDDFRIAVLLQF